MRSGYPGSPRRAQRRFSPGSTTRRPRPTWRRAAWVGCAMNPMGIQRAEGVVMVCVVNIRGGEIEFLQGVEVSVGERLFPQYVPTRRLFAEDARGGQEMRREAGA